MNYVMVINQFANAALNAQVSYRSHMLIPLHRLQKLS